MQTPQDLFERDRQQMQEQVRAAEEGRRKNVALFERMWLTLGADCITAAGSSHQAELAEALGIATSRWSRLLDMEGQVQREEQQIAARPKKRPSEVGDDLVPDRTLAERGRAWEEQTKHLRAAHAELRKLAETERKELESFVTKRR
jgi:hypothetical protein